MVASDQKISVAGLSAASLNVYAMRDTVLGKWEAEVRNSIAGARRLLHPVLVNTMPVFYDNIVEALTPDHPRQHATSNTDIAAAHGNERARMTAYEPEHIVHEYQLFRNVFSHVADEQGVVLTTAEWKVVHESIDIAMRESIHNFVAMHDTFRTRMAASLSHDMRNPLSVVIGAAHLLALGAGPEKAPAIAQKILEHGARLDTMITELLDALSIQRGGKLPLFLSRFDMRELAVKVCADAGTDAVPCSVSGDPTIGYWCENSIRRALENLIANAVKYGDKTKVQINVVSDHDRMMLSVHNTGNPIDMENRGRIFQYLWREESAREQSGWGIGLPFVQTVAESHGGSVVVDSSPESGTTFLMDLPLDTRPFAGNAADTAVQPPPPPLVPLAPPPA